MKKIIASLVFVFLCAVCYCQPSQYIGSPTGIVHVRGAVIGDSAIIVAKRDTANHPWKDSVGVMTIFNGQLYVTTSIGGGVNKWSPIATGVYSFANGLSVNNGIVQLGQTYGDPLNPAALTGPIQIPMSGNTTPIIFDGGDGTLAALVPTSLQLAGDSVAEKPATLLMGNVGASENLRVIAYPTRAWFKMGSTNFTLLNDGTVNIGGELLPSTGYKLTIEGNEYIHGISNGVQQLIKLPAAQTAASAITQIVNNANDTLVELRAEYGLRASSVQYVNMFIGYKSGIANTTTTLTNNGTYLTALGYKALMSNTTGRANTALGSEALRDNTTGPFNSAFGQGALINMISGSDNIGFGQNSLRGFTTGNQNVGIGNNVGDGNLSGSDNIFIGHQSGLTTNATYSQNVFIGTQAGNTIGTTSSGNVAIGYRAAQGITLGNNKLYIANSNTSTPLIYGEFDNKILSLSDVAGKFGIRTKTPLQALHVAGQVQIDTLQDGVNTDSATVVNNGLIKKRSVISIGINIYTGSDATLAMGFTYSDYFYSGSGGNTWSLPAVSGTANHVITVSNIGSGTLTIDVTGAGSTIFTDSAVSSTGLLVGGVAVFKSNGTYWKLQ